LSVLFTGESFSGRGGTGPLFGKRNGAVSMQGKEEREETKPKVAGREKLDVRQPGGRTPISIALSAGTEE